MCFRLRDTDEANRHLLESVNVSGRIFLTHTKINDAYTLRLAIGSPATTEEHIATAWDLLRDHAH
ncbi:hypothetical protein [Nocardia sp. NPDC051570]|uniref:hypothetical protein n=1 Tax=Nocardia sp. NPDC051570 TaxID=3364324 RepID=UPI0037911D16